jgi:hypothetical protein
MHLLFLSPSSLNFCTAKVAMRGGFYQRQVSTNFNILQLFEFIAKSGEYR